MSGLGTFTTRSHVKGDIMEYNNERVFCYYCNRMEDKLVTYYIKGRNYLSNFDSMDTKICLCEQCNTQLEVESEWFDNSVCFADGDGGYLYESYIINLIESFPLTNQERILNDPSDNLTREMWLELHSL